MPVTTFPVTTLFPPERLLRGVRITSQNRTGQTAYATVEVRGADGVERLVERSRTLTGVEYQAAVRRGAEPAVLA